MAHGGFRWLRLHGGLPSVPVALSPARGQKGVAGEGHPTAPGSGGPHAGQETGEAMVRQEGVRAGQSHRKRGHL